MCFVALGIGGQYRGTVPRYFFSTGNVGTVKKRTGTAVPVLLFLKFLAVLGTFAKSFKIKKEVCAATPSAATV